ncbi:hypothetical protein V6N13_091161 [Hibiscus sabdariffa]
MPSAPVAFVDAAPICAFPEPTPVSSPLAAPPTAAYVDDGEDDDVLEEVDAVMGVSHAVTAPVIVAPTFDAIE